MSQVYLCPRCKSRVERPSPEITRVWCWRCGKKLNFGKEPRRLERGPEPVASQPAGRGGHELPSAVAEASEKRQMPSFGTPVYQQPVMAPAPAPVVQHYQPPRRSAALLFVGSALVSAIVVTLILIGYMIVVSSLDKQNTQNAGLTDQTAVGQPGGVPQTSPKSQFNSGSNIPSNPEVLFPKTEPVTSQDIANNDVSTSVDRGNQIADRNTGSSARGAEETARDTRGGDQAKADSNRGRGGIDRGNRSDGQRNPGRFSPPPRSFSEPDINGLANVKSATALIVNGQRMGSAFCIDDRGVFVTDTRVLQGKSQGDFVRLVLNAGETNVKRYQARIALNDASTQLALLTANVNDTFPTVRFGQADRVEAGDSVVAVGYPSRDGSYASVRANEGQVTTVARESGVIDKILNSARMESAGVGGPLLNRNGEVVGIVAADDQSARADAIPIDRVRKLVQWTFAKVVAPNEIAVTDIRDPFEVHLDVFSQSDSPFYANVFVTLTKQEFEMNQLQNHFSATVDLGGTPIDTKSISSIRLIVRVFEGRETSSRDRRVISIIHDIKVVRASARSKTEDSGRGKAQ